MSCKMMESKTLSLSVLHKVLLPRINISLEEFANSWNMHPLTSENNMKPVQIRATILPPQEFNVLLVRIVLF